MNQLTGHEIAVRNWLLALLRFALTLDDADRNEVLGYARALDRAGRGEAAGSFSFFHSESVELCAAIAAPQRPGRAETLRRHLARIADARLRHAMEAALGATVQTSRAKPTDWLWRGL
jgi:hypothetical protein